MALAKSVGVELRGTFGRRRTGWSKEEGKPACFELGSTERLKAICPAWALKKTEDVRVPGIFPKPG